MAKAIKSAKEQAHLRSCIEDMVLNGQYRMAADFCCDAALAGFMDYAQMSRVAGAIIRMEEEGAGLEVLDKAWDAPTFQVEMIIVPEVPVAPAPEPVKVSTSPLFMEF